ncbi:site-specific integrase [Rhodococcus sp. 06-418-1B]|nr:site-specific integrase [Rhodococcus sp. 06-418-1B]
MARTQLPPQIRKLTITDRKTGRAIVRYEVRVDTGSRTTTRKNPDGTTTQIVNRTQSKRRFATEQAARQALAETTNKVSNGTFIHSSELTLAHACERWLDSKHKLKESSLRGHRVNLQPVISEIGGIPVQKLTKTDIDSLVKKLRAGGLPLPNGRARKPWSARTVNYMLSLLTAILDDQLKQGSIIRNVAAMVDRLPTEAVEMETLSQVEAKRLLKYVDRDPMAHAWHLALSGLRRGEIAGLRWSDVDFKKNTISIANSRVAVGSRIVEGTPKSRRSKRRLPLPKPLAAALKAAKAQQAEDKLLLGVDYTDSIYVVRLPSGEAVHPNLLTFRWKKVLKAAGLKSIRLHDARHTCATLMHLQGVPIAVIAAWLGHASAAFTLSVYAHSQEDALLEAANSFDPLQKRRKST